MLLIRILLGLFFLLSGISKLFSMESFELYIFSMGIASFDLCALAARLAIVFEIVAGLVYIAGIYRKPVNWCAFGILAFFSAFLLWRIALGDTRSCHCMGEWADLSPFDSLVKNAILLIFVIRLALHYHNQSVLSGQRQIDGPCSRTGAAVCTCGCSGPALDCQTHLDRWLDNHRKTLLSVLVPLVILSVFIAVPPDFFFRAGRESHDVNQEKFEAVSQKHSFSFHEGKKLVCFYSTSCDFCRNCSQKLSGIIKRHHIPENAVHVFFMQTVTEQDSLVHDFYQNYGSGIKLDYSVVHPYDFIPMTNGSLPLVILLDHGEIIEEFDYISLSESKISSFFD